MSLFRNKRFLHAEITQVECFKICHIFGIQKLFLYYRLLVAFHWVISSNMILLFLKSELTIIVLYMRNTIQQLSTGYIIDVPFSIQCRKTSNEKVPSFSGT